MGGSLTIKAVYGGTLAPIEQVKTLLAAESDIERVNDFAKAVEAAKNIDGENSERRNYWGELAIWSTCRLGELIIEGQENGRISDGKKGRPKKASHDARVKLEDFGINHTRSSRAQRVALYKSRIPEYVAAHRESEVTKAGFVRFTAPTAPKNGGDLGPVHWLMKAERAALSVLEKCPREYVGATIAKMRRTIKQFEEALADDDD